MKIQIILEDRPNGSVGVKFTPSLADIVNRARLSNSSGLTPAGNYACVMASAVHEASKKLDNYDPNKDETLGL